MSTTPEVATISAVAAVLADHPNGATAATIARSANVSASAVRRALAALTDTGRATHTPGTGKGRNRTPDTWAPTATTAEPTNPDEAADHDTDTDADAETPGSEPPAGPTPDTWTAVPESSDSDEPAQDTSTPDEPVSAPPAAPTNHADRLKVQMVAAILGDHPNGVTAADIATESGMRAQIVGRVLTAMELATVATRTATESGDELWSIVPDADLSTVNPANVTAWQVCPTCGHRSRVRNGVTVGRTVSTAPGRNSDGQPTLAKGALREQVLDFLTTHAGHEFTPTTIAREIGRSSGAVGNALGVLVSTGKATLVREVPMTYTATGQ